MKRKLAENLKHVQQRIAAACSRAKRDPSGVKLVAVTKSATFEHIRLLVELGLTFLGESRAQELVRRAAMSKEWLARRRLDASATAVAAPHWHMIGHLQRNKVRTLLPWVDMIHSVDSLRLAEEIDAESGRLERRTPILLEVNAAAESDKHGVAVAATTHLVEQVATLKHLEICGLMAMGPTSQDYDATRHCFQRTRELFDEITGERLCGRSFRELSLGMSGDFELGIEFGATFVRIGSALFEGIELAPEPVEVE